MCNRNSNMYWLLIIYHVRVEDYLLWLSYLFLLMFLTIYLSYLQRHLIRNHQMSHLHTPELIDVPFVLTLFINSHCCWMWSQNVRQIMYLCLLYLRIHRDHSVIKKKYFIGCDKIFHSLLLLIGLILVIALCSPSQRTRFIVTWTRVNASCYFWWLATELDRK